MGEALQMYLVDSEHYFLPWVVFRYPWEHWFQHGKDSLDSFIQWLDKLFVILPSILLWALVKGLRTKKATRFVWQHTRVKHWRNRTRRNKRWVFGRDRFNRHRAANGWRGLILAASGDRSQENIPIKASQRSDPQFLVNWDIRWWGQTTFRWVGQLLVTNYLMHYDSLVNLYIEGDCLLIIRNQYS